MVAQLFASQEECLLNYFLFESNQQIQRDSREEQNDLLPREMPFSYFQA